MLGVCDQGKLRYVENTGTGFSDGQLKNILKQLTPHLLIPVHSTQDLKPTREHNGLSPKVVCEVRFQEWTSDGKLRTPAFLQIE